MTGAGWPSFRLAFGNLPSFRKAADRLGFPAILAASRIASDQSNDTLQATELVHAANMKQLGAGANTPLAHVTDLHIGCTVPVLSFPKMIDKTGVAGESVSTS